MTDNLRVRTGPFSPSTDATPRSRGRGSAGRTTPPLPESEGAPFNQEVQGYGGIVSLTPITEERRNNWGRRTAQALSLAIVLGSSVWRATELFKTSLQIQKLFAEIGIGAGASMAMEACSPEAARKFRQKAFPVSVEVLQFLTLLMLNANVAGESVSPSLLEALQALKVVYWAGLSTTHILAYRTLSFHTFGTGALLTTPGNPMSPRTLMDTLPFLTVSLLLSIFGLLAPTLFLHSDTGLEGRAMVYFTSLPLGLLLGDRFARFLSQVVQNPHRHHSTFERCFGMAAKVATVAHPTFIVALTSAAMQDKRLYGLMALVSLAHGATLYFDWLTMGRRSYLSPPLAFGADLKKRLLTPLAIAGNAALVGFLGYEAFLDPETRTDRSKGTLAAFAVGLYGTYLLALTALRHAHQVPKNSFLKAAYFVLLEHRLLLPLLFMIFHGEVSGMNDTNINDADFYEYILMTIGLFIYGAQFGANRVSSGFKVQDLAPPLFLFLGITFIIEQFTEAFEES